MHTYTRQLVRELSAHADAELAKGMKAYMRDQFEYFGIKSPIRRQIVRSFFKEQGLPELELKNRIIQELWSQPQREAQYAAMDICDRFSKKAHEGDIELYENLICTKSWWDTVDAIAAHQVGAYFKQRPKEVKSFVQRWIHCDNMWLNRTAIIFQLGYKSATDLELLRSAIMPHIESKEFFLQKAIGWALRQYSYTDEAWVRDFVNEVSLKPLSVREALKALLRKEAEAGAKKKS